MGTERKAPPMSGFFKMQQVGDAASGWLKSVITTKEAGTFGVFEPLCTRAHGQRKSTSWKSGAIGFSTDIRLKITKKDEGRFFSLRLSELEDTSKGNPKKIFTILELSAEEFNTLLVHTIDNTREVFPLVTAGAGGPGSASDLDG